MQQNETKTHNKKRKEENQKINEKNLLKANFSTNKEKKRNVSLAPESTVANIETHKNERKTQNDAK